MIIQIFVCCYLRVVFPLDVARISITSFVSGLFNMWTYMISVIFAYDFPIHRYTGMFITVLASANNLGNTIAVHTKILSWCSWWIMSWVGIGLQLLIVLWIYF
jgi:hypothetical protein